MRLSRPCTSLLSALLAVTCTLGCENEDSPAGTADGGVDAALPDAGDGGTPDEGGLVVTTKQGAVRGMLSQGARAFLGIPYGVPPVGDKRFSAPEPAAGWQGVREATDYGAPCAQLNSLGTAYDPASKEDCLYLNVWAPESPPDKPLPVMVWLFGGAFLFGNGGPPYNGEALVREGNVVVVTLNYRIGAPGFLAHPALTAEARAQGRPVGNVGLLDQRLALAWVRDNIAAFGGDKDNVTLFGESAGGYSACMHMQAEGSRGLFHRAIVESGLCMKPSMTLAEAEALGQRYATAMGCTDPAQALACLRALDPMAMMKGPPVTKTPGSFFYQDTNAQFFFQPFIDGEMLLEQTEAAFAAGRFERLPVLHGVNTDEGVLFHIGLLGDAIVSNETDYLAALSTRFGARAPEVAAQYPFSADALARVTGDWAYRCPAVRMARYLSAAGVPNYLYRFNLKLQTPVPMLATASFHSAEIPYVFGNRFTLGSVPPEQAERAQAIRGYWTRFAATSDPNGAGAVAWPAHDATSRQHLNLDDPIAAGADLGAGCDFWDGFPITPP